VRPAPTWSSDGRRSLTEHATDVRLAPIDYLRQMPAGDAIVLYGNLPPIRLRTTPWFADRELRQAGWSDSDGKHAPRRPA
jgi:type IV secretory pathway TraG/TraD family ATPase VirD4